MKATKDGKIVELGESGFKVLQSKGWERVLEVVDDAPEGEDQDYKQEEKESEVLIDEGSDETPLPEWNDDEIKEVKAKKGKTKK